MRFTLPLCVFLLVSLCGLFSCSETEPDTAVPIPVDTLAPVVTPTLAFEDTILAPVEVDGLWGYINLKGEMVIPATYGRAFCFAENVAAVKQDSLWGVLDRQGDWVLPPSYDSLGLGFNEGLIAFMSDDQWGFANLNGTEVIPAHYDGAGLCSEGRCDVKVDGGWGFVTLQDSMVIPPTLLNATCFYEGVTMVTYRRGGRQGVLDKDGNAVNEMPDWLEFREGLAPKEVGQYQWAYVNEAREVIIPGPFKQAAPFYDGMAAVRYGDDWGFINLQGEMVIEPQYEAKRHFADGLCPVLTKDDQWQLIDKTGKALKISDPQPTSYHAFRNGTCAAEIEEQWGLIDTAGNWVVNARFKRLARVDYDGLPDSNFDLRILSLQHAGYTNRQQLPFYWAGQADSFQLINSQGEKLFTTPQVMPRSFN